MKTYIIVAFIVGFLLCVSVMSIDESAEMQGKQERIRILQEKFEYDRQKVLFERRSYADRVQIKAEVVGDNFLHRVVLGEAAGVEDQLTGDSAYLVLRLTNSGRSTAWGTLRCNISDTGDFEVNVPSLSPQDKSRIFVIPLDGVPLKGLNRREMRIICEWASLSVKP